PVTLTRSQGTARPHLVIRASVGHVTLLTDASGLWSAEYARALLGATITSADYKEVCTSHGDVLMQCSEDVIRPMYGQRWPYSAKWGEFKNLSEHPH
ncbi:hypothetical protein C1H46_032868, partial [Malus baccata]